MISVMGEALVDLVITPGGAVEAALGGAPFNTARACARLGVPVRFVGAVSVDRFGSMIADQLGADGVDVSELQRVEVPTTLAAAELDADGAASYRFYLDGTSAPALEAVGAGAASGDVVFTGGLGLVVEPMAAVIEAAIAARTPDQVIVIDINCRPRVIVDRDAYVGRVRRVLANADVVKVSDEDLAYLSPGSDPLDAARALLDGGVGAVLLTMGGEGVQVLTAGRTSRVAAEAVDVIDTIGAGDTFGGGFVSWWHVAGYGRTAVSDHEKVERAVRAANQVAAVVVGRRGADPPWRRELPADWSS